MFRTLMALLATVSVVVAGTVGEPAPDFSVTDTNGKARTLSEFKGKYVVLEWVSHQCPFVEKFYGSGEMQKLQKEWTGKGVVWLSVCSSAPGNPGHMGAEDWNKTIAEKGMAGTAVLMDGDGKMGKAYGAKTTPHMFVIDPSGKLIYAGAIDSIASPKPEDIATAENYVVKALEESMAGKAVTTASTRSYGCGVKY